MPNRANASAFSWCGRIGRQLGFLLLVAVFPAALTGWLHPKRPGLPGAVAAAETITLKDALLQARSQPVLWVDARRTPAFEADHVPGAVHLTEDAWEQLLPAFVDAWQPGQLVVVYCDNQRCDGSWSVAQRLRREFQTGNVYSLEGGWESWLSRQK